MMGRLPERTLRETQLLPRNETVTLRMKIMYKDGMFCRRVRTMLGKGMGVRGGRVGVGLDCGCSEWNSVLSCECGRKVFRA